MNNFIKNINPLKLVLLLLVISLSGCVEQTFVDPKLYGSIEGVVLSAKEKLPLKNVIVRINPSGKNLQTDSLGRFSLDSLELGKYSVQSSLDKYRSDVTSVTVEENRLTDVIVYLKLDNNQNKPPLKAKVISPKVGSTDNGLTTELRWETTDPDKDTLRYNVILFKEGEAPNKIMANQIWYDSLVVKNLEYNTNYFWQVVSMDSTNAPVYGEVWNFKTREASQLPYFYSRMQNDNFQIFATDGSENIQLTNFGGNWRPVVSPNREKIAYISNVNTIPHIFISDRTGKFKSKVTVVPIAGVSNLDLGFCWSPNGTELLYPSFDKLYAVKTDGTGLREVAQAPAGKFFSGCDWTEQGNRIVARVTGSTVYNNSLYLVNPTTGILSELVTGRAGRMSNPDFSPDGKTVVFAIDLANFQNNVGRQLNSNIQVVDIQTGITTDISTDKVTGTNDLEPKFSPNGSKVIFTNTSNDGVSIKNILSLKLDGSERLILFENGEMPDWR